MATKKTPERKRVAPGIFERKLKDGSVVHDLLWTENGKQRKRVKRDHRLGVAKEELTAIKAKINRGESVAQNVRLTFEEAAEAWLASVDHFVQVGDIKPNTLYSYREQIKVHLLPRWGSRQLSSITKKDITGLIAEKRKEGKKTESIKKFIGPARQTFNFAATELGWRGVNPVSLLNQRDMPKPDSKQARVLSSSEVKALLGALDPDYRCLVNFALSTGCRSGEIRGLRWGKIDTQAKTVKIDKQVDRFGNYASVKTGRKGEKVIPLSDDLWNELVAHKLRSPYSGPDDYVFASKVGTPIKAHNLSRVLKKALKKAKIAEPYPTMHDFRHTFASAFIAARAGDAVQLSKLLGHANPLVTLQRYSHEFEVAERGKELQANLSKLWA